MYHLLYLYTNTKNISHTLYWYSYWLQKMSILVFSQHYVMFSGYEKTYFQQRSVFFFIKVLVKIKFQIKSFVIFNKYSSIALPTQSHYGTNKGNSWFLHSISVLSIFHLHFCKHFESWFRKLWEGVINHLEIKWIST